MKLKTLTKEEFKKIADKSPQITFHQTTSWANLKKKKSAHLPNQKEVI